MSHLSFEFFKEPFRANFILILFVDLNAPAIKLPIIDLDQGVLSLDEEDPLLLALVEMLGIGLSEQRLETQVRLLGEKALKVVRNQFDRYYRPIILQASRRRT